MAIASFNNHETFFGEAFSISLARYGHPTSDRATPAWSGCVAFGIERWLLALLVEHGLNPRDWPLVEQAVGEMSHEPGAVLR
jgi:hypothetical protein